tara:strand:+ start:3560 stop:3790 length:231 start_codon:yes stop_codon:yes gene_type:complete
MISHKNRWCFGWIFDSSEGVKTIPYRNQGSLIETTDEVLQSTHTPGELIAFTWTPPGHKLSRPEVDARIDKFYWEE